MSDSPISGPNPIDDFLSAEFLPNSAEPLREELLQRTTGLLRRRRRLRRLALAAALAACYAAGILTVQLLAPRSEAVEKHEVVQHLPETEKPKPDSESAPLPAAVVRNEDDSALTALDLEWKALDSSERRPDLFRKAGDRYLEESDIPSALRCYRSALDFGTEKDWQIATEDNWLFMSLKEAKLKEKRDAKDNG